MKVTAVDKYTGEKIYELEMKECEVEHIADVSRSVRLGECWAHMNDIPIQREYSDDNDTFFAAVNAGIAAAEYSNFRPFDVGDYVVCTGTGSYQLGRVASVRRPGGAIMIDAMGIERASDRWQVRAIERDTGKLIVFPHVFDDPDEAAHQFAEVCRSPHYRSVDIALVLD